jgi:hypothetical protein
MNPKTDIDQLNLTPREDSESAQFELFSPQQVVCIVQGDLRLFGEVVQMVPVRSRCWARPLAIAQVMPDSLQLALLYDLRESSHLLLPATVFRAALDTELIPLMTALFHPIHPKTPDPSEERQVESATRQALHEFIQALAIDRL